MRKDWWMGSWGLEIGITWDSWLLGLSWALRNSPYHESWLMVALLPVRLIVMYKKSGENG